MDGTGLYYYGARYYDPEIGRFISADTLVQSLVNPQTLNRYSYVLNSPLKYTDPSGHLVTRENETWILGNADYVGYIPVTQTILDWVQLRNAYTVLEGVAPELTQMLEAASQVTTIQWSNRVSTAGLAQASDWNTSGNMDMLMGSNLKGKSTGYLAAIMCHEGFHAAGYIQGAIKWTHKTAANEAFAYSMAYQASVRLGVDDVFIKNVPLSEIFKDITPFNAVDSLNAQVTKAGGTLLRSGYHSTGFFSGKPKPYDKWPGLTWLGRNKFLDVARSVWIRE